MQKILAILLMTMLVVACSSSDNVENNNVQDTEQSSQNSSDDNAQQNDESQDADNSDATNDANSDTSANDASANDASANDTSANNDTANNVAANDTWQSNVENTMNDAADSLNNATNDANDAMNNAADSTNDAMNNAVDNTAVNAGGSNSVLLILNFNDLVEEAEKAMITKATKNKWFKDKQTVELTEKAYYDQSAQYMGSTIFIGKVQRAYGEFTMDIRTGVVAKDDQGYYEEPISNWSVRGAQTAEELAKEIKYGDDVFAKK
ncbi:hypothetical protein [Candidatus Uabimicrobium amorphum]|uniref:Lipoprotein n=1 Tax=Uabimicrobium amorphum TaxID=2596890 RepID=A0A5S9IMW2_UABAM|nr:hypothetical protein [Candidatus Uabimicrobium amorphum]BBM84262.1 hypothetical protein UABAM_02619 [Candidatus Uabimicrobium amorphum]